jgi:uncharacterized protein (DUF1684 family)
MTDTEYVNQVAEIRSNRDKTTAANPLHWLNLAGLFWLEEGENTFGNSEKSAICLPQFPEAICGSFILKKGKVTLRAEKNVKLTVNGKAPVSRALYSDKDKNPDVIEIGTLTIKIIIRGGLPMIRIWDRDSQALKDFSGFHYYPAKPEYRVTAKFVHYDPPKPTIQKEMIGTENPGFFLGHAEFELNGTSYTLLAEKSGEQLLFNFRDSTNSDTTYGGGRRFYLPVPENDEIVLDFNLTDNWPCAYTAYATCPIPPRENHLPIRIEAGELKYK